MGCSAPKSGLDGRHRSRHRHYLAQTADRAPRLHDQPQATGRRRLPVRGGPSACGQAAGPSLASSSDRTGEREELGGKLAGTGGQAGSGRSGSVRSLRQRVGTPCQLHQIGPDGARRHVVELRGRLHPEPARVLLPDLADERIIRWSSARYLGMVQAGDILCPA